MEMSHSLALRLLPLLVLVHLAIQATAHNWITNPMTYNKIFPTRRCHGSQCNSACPYILRRAEMANRPERPAKIWRRGQVVTISWARNNHHGGIARFSLVPVPLMMSRAAHAQFTLFHTCWQAGGYSCRKDKKPCGTDREGIGYKRRFRIPNIFPDGDYVLGHVWYGGLHYSRWWGQFPDYYSCAFVRIRGGPFSRKPYRMKFIPGRGSGVKRGMCHTSSLQVGNCHRWGCRHRRAFYGIPKPFWWKKPQPAITVKQIVTGLKKKTWILNVLRGNCNYFACCPKVCGPWCGGRDCHERGLPAKWCCTASIRRSGRKCRWVAPPCMRH